MALKLEAGTGSAFPTCKFTELDWPINISLITLNCVQWLQILAIQSFAEDSIRLG